MDRSCERGTRRISVFSTMCREIGVLALASLSGLVGAPGFTAASPPSNLDVEACHTYQQDPPPGIVEEQSQRFVDVDERGRVLEVQWPPGGRGEIDESGPAAAGLVMSESGVRTEVWRPCTARQGAGGKPLGATPLA